MTDIEQQTTAILRRFVAEKADKSALNDDELLNTRLADLGFDSLENMELVMQIEDAFGVSLEEEDILRCAKVADLAELVKRSR